MRKTPLYVALLLAFCSLLSAKLLPAAEGRSNANRPNVVFILSDDQSWDSFGFMGGNVHTPRLDQMAKDGLYLRNFNVTSTVCSPSRYSFLTGRYAGRCEGERFLQEHPPGDQTQVENIGELESHRWNLAKVLQNNGYYTGFVGKSHVVRHDLIHNNVGWEQDADPSDPETNALMQLNHNLWCDELRMEGFDFADGVYGANLKELYCDALNVHNLDWTIDNAMEFLDSVDEDPFFLCVSTTLHHGPAPWVNENALLSDPRMTGEGFVAEGFNVLPSRGDVLARNRAAGFADRDAYALWLDDGVGAIIDKINQLGLSEETLIVFVPDHGSYRHGKATLHEFGMRVPMLCLWPGTIEPDSTNDEIIANIDFAPTVMDVCGVTPPEDYRYDGMSFKTALHGDQTPLRDVLFGELGHSRCVKTKDWKYIAIRYPDEIQALIDQGHQFDAFQDNPLLDRPYLTRNLHLGHFAAQVNPNYFSADQLYDLNTDPHENHNIADQHPEIVELLKQELATELQEFEDRPFGEFTGQDQSDIVTSFDVDLSPDTQVFVTANASTLQLNYTIGSFGNVSLATNAGGASPARWNQVNNGSAGTTTSAALFGTSFTLTFSGSAGANAILSYPAYDNAGTGAVLATQGQGNKWALEDGEFVEFTVNGSATLVPDFSLDLVNFSYDLRLANGQSSFGVEDSSGTVIEQLIPNSALEGTIDGSGISLAAGETMTFRTIAGSAGGAGLSGFEFRVTAETASVLLGDVDLNGTVDFLDISPFIALLSGGTFQAEADIDASGVVDFLDISPFIAILSGS